MALELDAVTENTQAANRTRIFSLRSTRAVRKAVIGQAPRPPEQGERMGCKPRPSPRGMELALMTSGQPQDCRAGISKGAGAKRSSPAALCSSVASASRDPGSELESGWEADVDPQLRWRWRKIPESLNREERRGVLGSSPILTPQFQSSAPPAPREPRAGVL